MSIFSCLFAFSMTKERKGETLSMKPFYFVVPLTAAALFFFAMKSPETTPEAQAFLAEEPAVLKIPLGLPPIPWPEDNPYDEKKAELGRLLYFDKRLSTDGTISCGSCHSIPRAYTDRRKVSVGIEGKHGSRHAPTVINSAYETHLFWDGRASSLEEQAKGPIANPKEMTLIDDVHQAHLDCARRVGSIKEYQILFKEVFGKDEINIDDVAKAIASFERTILSGNSPYDKYMAGDKKAMTEEQIHGMEVFKKSGCANCHFGSTFTDGRFLNIGIGMDKPDPDLGRYNITKDMGDWGAFKVPTLREIENTYPYMHDGSLATLEEVVEYYDKGGIPNKGLSRLMKPLHLSDKDKKDLVSFMKALSGEGWQHFTEPKEFPE